MTVTDHYAANTRRAEAVLTNALDGWRNGLNNWTAPFQTLPTTPRFPQFDVAEVLEQQVKVLQQFIDVNVEYARQLAEASNTVSSAVRQHIDGLSTVLFNQIQTVSETLQGTVETFEESVRETAEQAEQAQREQAEQAEQEDREQAEQAERAEREKRQQAQKVEREKRQQVREHYRALTKNELSEEAAKRNLPKTGTVDELVDRLVQDVTSK
jgi:hypothetical protein